MLVDPDSGGRDPGAIVGAVAPVPLVLDLLAALLDGGASPQAALRSVGDALREAGDPRGGRLLVLAETGPVGPAGSCGALGVFGAVGARGAGGDEIADPVAEALRLAVRAGLPPAALIRRAAEQERRRATTAHLRAVRRLEVMLVLPAGLCLLPAFVLLSIVPVLLDLVLG